MKASNQYIEKLERASEPLRERPETQVHAQLGKLTASWLTLAEIFFESGTFGEASRYCTIVRETLRALRVDCPDPPAYIMPLGFMHDGPAGDWS